MRNYSAEELEAMSIDELKDLMTDIINERESYSDPMSVAALRLDDLYAFLDSRLGQLELETMKSIKSEFGPPVGPGENEFWHIVHECDDENDNPCEWATKLPNGDYIWIDKEENNFFGVYLYADSSQPPEKTFRSLKAAQEYVEKTYRNIQVNEEQTFRRGGRHR